MIGLFFSFFLAFFFFVISRYALGLFFLALIVTLLYKVIVYKISKKKASSIGLFISPVISIIYVFINYPVGAAFVNERNYPFYYPAFLLQGGLFGFGVNQVEFFIMVLLITFTANILALRLNIF